MAVLALDGCGGPLTEEVARDCGGDGGGDAGGGDADADADATPDSDGDDSDGDGGVEDDLPARYPPDEVLSPVTAYVAEVLRGIRLTNDELDDAVFMKVGASGTVNEALLTCFAGVAGSGYVVDLDGREGELWPAIEHFRRGDAAGTTPFDRRTLAAEVGRTARWAISGDPSPVEEEIDAISPRFALVNYGTNDMNMGTTHASALFPFYEAMASLLDGLAEEGIVPVVTGLNPRGDSDEAALWVPTYDAVTRGMAEARQIPFIDLFLAVRDLPGMGLLSDGLHGNAYTDDEGRSQPCVMTPAGLDFNYNVRNLLTLETLEVLRRVVLAGDAAPHRGTDTVLGDGTAEDPFVVDALPFSHAASTALDGEARIDGYPACDSGQDESGPEVLYVLDLDEETPVRLIVLGVGEVDVDLHLLATELVAEGCLVRADRMIETTLPAGTYHVALDSFVPSDGVARSGDYLFVALACEPGDEGC